MAALRFALMGGRRNSKLVAIVEDDESLRNALQDLIESYGLSALGFDLAEEFLKSYARHNAACLIADVRLPGMSGLELQAKLNADRCRLPVIFITAHGNAEMRMRAMRDGAMAFFDKPFDDAALLSAVDGAIEGEAKDSTLIAVVDDSESLQEALRHLIESDGLSALCFGSAEEFLESDSRHHAACVIVDIQMPGMSGLELQARLKTEHCRLPIIFITACRDAEIRAVALRQGAIELLTKPFDTEVLLQVVHAALRDDEMSGEANRGHK